VRRGEDEATEAERLAVKWRVAERLSCRCDGCIAHVIEDEVTACAELASDADCGGEEHCGCALAAAMAIRDAR